MKEPWKKMDCTKIQLTTAEEFETSQKSPPKQSLCDSTSTFYLILILLLGALATGYVFWRINQVDLSRPAIVLSSDEFRKLMTSIVNDDFNGLLAEDEDDKASYAGELQLLDEDYNVLWSKDLDKAGLKNLDEKITSFRDEEYPWDVTTTPAPERRTRSVHAISQPVSSSRPKKYVVSHQTRFVNCERFKPIPRGRYLVSPSLPALHTCYKHGVRADELERGVARNPGREMRYDLVNLYLACGEVFDENVDELTDELVEDYERCKWSGALDWRQQAIVEERFGDRIASVGRSGVPSQLQASSTTAASPVLPNVELDPRGFVECGHVETELFEDYFESPSYEALQRCQRFGVRASDLKRGVARNPRFNEVWYDVASLYLACGDVFDEHLEYMTSELRDDYRRCKMVGALSEEVQRAMEKKFYEALDEERGASTEKTTITSTTTITNVQPSSTSESTSDVYETTTSTTAGKRRYAFANCKRIENKAYLICIKVIKVYSTPIQYV